MTSIAKITSHILKMMFFFMRKKMPKKKNKKLFAKTNNIWKAFKISVNIKTLCLSMNY